MLRKILLAILLTFCLGSINKLEFLSDLFETRLTKSKPRYANAYPREGDYHINVIIESELNNHALASAIYTDSWKEEGWDYLQVISRRNVEFSNKQQAYAAGYIEGFLTKNRIYNHYLNMKQYLFSNYNNEMPPHVRKFFTNNREWIKNLADSNRGDAFWDHAILLQTQIEGLIDGYNQNISEKDRTLSYEDFQVMNAFGDIFDIVYWKESERPNFAAMSAQQLDEYIEKHTHCSSIIKLADDFSDLFTLHNSWFGFITMTRIFKEYKLEFNSVSPSITLSGYPGTLSSVDDFYLTSNKLYVAETTNPTFNEKLFEKIAPESVLTWMRAMIANYLSMTGRDWVETFAKFNSGTYNNQFMVIDYKQVDLKNKKLNSGTFWIIEQIPGLTVNQEMTEHLLTNKYWASYNAAYFKEIREQSKYDETIAAHSDMVDKIDHEKCARANIFRRDQSNIKTVEDAKYIMRYNDFKNDPLSKHNASLSLAGRGDLNESNARCSGGLDAKVTSYKTLLENRTVHIISGPTTQNQPPFETNNTRCNVDGKLTFHGFPDVWNYDWIEYQPSFLFK
jgi:hypothetical protein